MCLYIYTWCHVSMSQIYRQNSSVLFLWKDFRNFDRSNFYHLVCNYINWTILLLDSKRNHRKLFIEQFSRIEILSILQKKSSSVSRSKIVRSLSTVYNSGKKSSSPLLPSIVCLFLLLEWLNWTPVKEIPLLEEYSWKGAARVAEDKKILIKLHEYFKDSHKRAIKLN